MSPDKHPTRGGSNPGGYDLPHSPGGYELSQSKDPVLKLHIRNSRVITVGPPPAVTPPASYGGYPVDFTSIQDAMNAVPLIDPEGDFVDRWTILVTTGYYEEEIRCKPHVNIVGINKESVYIQPPPGRPRDRDDPRLANVYLSSLSLLSNVTLANRQDSEPGDVVVWGFDTFQGMGGDVHDLGLWNVDLLPFSPYPDNPNSVDGYSKGGLIRLEGNWHTAIFRDVGGNYIAPDRYGITLVGTAKDQNADCHFTNCFFDALYLTDTSADCGCLLVQDCFEVHVRNSFLRINKIPAFGEPQAMVPAPGSAVATRSTRDSLTNVFVEGSSLECNDPAAERVLDVGSGTFCFFKHSSSDSRTGDGVFIPSGRDGIGTG